MDLRKYIPKITWDDDLEGLPLSVKFSETVFRAFVPEYRCDLTKLYKTNHYRTAPQIRGD